MNKHNNQNRRGITLIELLVVITIMMILAAIVLPQLKFGTEGYKIREAARMVSTYLNAARNKAIETGRPVGVLFERTDELVLCNHIDGDLTKDDPDTSIVSVQMSQIQVPQPYAGDVTGCKIHMTGAMIGFIDGTQIQYNLLRVGDRIQLDNKGPWYRIDGQDVYNNLTGNTPEPDGIVDPGLLDVWDSSSNALGTDGFNEIELVLTLPAEYGKVKTPTLPLNTPLSFQIKRQASSTFSGLTDTYRIVRSMTPPQRLPHGTAVDLTASGIGGWTNGGMTNRFFSSSNFPVAIIYNPDGSMDVVHGLGAQELTPISPYPYCRIRPSSEPANQPVYLLVGREMQAPGAHGVSWYVDPDTDSANTEERPNWQDPESRWVIISPTTGVSTVAKNMDIGKASNWTSASSPDAEDVRRDGIPAARQMASEGLDGGDRK